MKDFDLNRFLVGQQFGYDWALKEIQAGKKEGHWIWYVFPQLRGLGHSLNSRVYGIDGREEAEAYLKHEVLNARLRDISSALLRHKGTPISEIMLGIDCLKLKSSMTLFDAICPNDIFDEVLQCFFEGKRDKVTLKMIGGESEAKERINQTDKDYSV